MKKATTINRNVANLLAPLSLFGLLIVLMKSPLLNQGSNLGLAISIDLLITVPLVYYLLIRKSSIPNTTVVPMMVVGLLIGTYFLPVEDQVYLELFKTWALPVIEVLILILVVVKVRKAIKTFKDQRGNAPDFYSTLKNTCHQLLPKQLAWPFATEVAVIYYGFINWKGRELQENEFSYHKRSGTPALFGALIFIIAMETFALHLLLERWNVVVAWILSGLSIYTAIQFLGFAKSLSKRPISITQHSLILRYGILSETEIPFPDIDTIELSRKPLEKDKLNHKLSPLGELESHNVIIHLNSDNELRGLYGSRKKFRKIGLHIDQPKDFKEKLEYALPQRTDDNAF